MDFVAGLKTLGGSGEPTLREGLAVHIYAANVSMERSAFVNGDGDFLILPQQGRLDIQTEFGRLVNTMRYILGIDHERIPHRLMVRPGELVVLQRGIKYKVW